MRFSARVSSPEIITTSVTVMQSRSPLLAGREVTVELPRTSSRVFDVHAALFHPLPAAKQEVFSGRVALGLDPIGT